MGAPIIVNHINDAIFRYREEERVQLVMADAVKAMGLKAEFEKRAAKHLQAAYDSAHFHAEFGESSANSLDMGHVQDFVLAWMENFNNRGWDVLESGLSSSGNSEKIAAMSILFHYVTDPDHSCLPHDLMSLIESPPSNWIRDFITRAATKMFAGKES